MDERSFEQHYATGQFFEQSIRGPVACPVKQAIDHALVLRAGYTLVAAVTGKRIRVISYAVSQWNAAANSVTFFSNASQIYPVISLPAANDQLVVGENKHGWFETNTGEGLLINTGLAGIDTFIRYIEYTP